MASLASSGIKALSSLLARSWSRKALRVLRNSAANSAQGIGRAHIDDADGFDARPQRLGIDEVGRFAGWHAAPELLFRRGQNAEVERVHGNCDGDRFAATGDDREDRGPQVGDPHVMLDLRHILFGSGLLEERQGNMNLASNMASVSSTTPSSVVTIQEIAECLMRRWMSRMVRPVLRSYQVRLSSS